MAFPLLRQRSHVWKNQKPEVCFLGNSLLTKKAGNVAGGETQRSFNTDAPAHCLHRCTAALWDTLMVRAPPVSPVNLQKLVILGGEVLTLTVCNSV